MIAVKYPGGAEAISIIDPASPVRRLEIIRRWALRGMYPAEFLRKVLALVVSETDPTDGHILRCGLECVDAIDQLEKRGRAA